MPVRRRPRRQLGDLGLDRLLDRIELAVIGQRPRPPAQVRRLRLDELAPRVGIATHLDDVAAGVDAVVAAEGVGLQGTRENP